MNTNSKFSEIKDFKGFTLIELLVVVAIIGLLSTVIAQPIMNARKKASDARKVADLNAISAALVAYADSKGTYPQTLALLVPAFLPTVPVQATVSSIDSYFYTTYCNTAACPVDTAVGYHLYTRLDVKGNAGLNSDADCGGGAATTCMSTAPTAVAVNLAPNAGTAGLLGASAVDVAANADADSTTCTAIGNSPCIYDLTGNI